MLSTFHDEHGTFVYAKFHSKSWLYILTACMRVSSSFSFFANSLMSSMYIRWLILSCDLLSLYPAAHFPSLWFNGIMAIMNRKGESASPSKSLFGSLFQLSFFLLLSFPLSSFSCFFRWSLWLETVCCTALWNNIICFFVVNPGHSQIFRLGLLSFRMCWSM